MLHFLRGNDGSTPGTAISSDNEGNGNESEGDYRMMMTMKRTRTTTFRSTLLFLRFKEMGDSLGHNKMDGYGLMACAPS